MPGTTRDLLTERVDVGGVPLTLIDTAGMRATPGDAIEEEGIARARQARDAADVMIVVLDGSRPLSDEDRALAGAVASRPRIVVANKCDLPAAWDDEGFGARRVSSLTDEGMTGLREALLEAAGVEPTRDRAPIANLRHAALLEQARESLVRAQAAAAGGLAEEFVLADLYDARTRFDAVTGARPQDEVLRTIFERFCIGK
jgi:tRNA modification GTPase